MTAIDFIRRAAEADTDAARYAAEPNGAGLAIIRRRDAKSLRRMAVTLRQTEAPEGICNDE